MIEKDLVFGLASARALEFARSRGVPEEGSCLYLAYYGALEIALRGLRPLLQAGSAGWPRVRTEEDNGAGPTHFSYVWSPAEEPSRMALAVGLMPEMHVWIGLPDSGEIVDFSTGLFPVQAKKLMGYDWPLELLPPSYFWGGPAALGRAYYNPDMAAIRCALRYIGDIYGADQLNRLLQTGHPNSVSPCGGAGILSSSRPRLV